MIFHFDALINPFYCAFWVDEEGCSLDAHVLLAVHAFLFIDPIVFNCMLVCVSQEVEREVEFRNKLGVACTVIAANSENNSILFGVFTTGVTEATTFFGAAWGIVFGIEVENNPLSFVVTKTVQLAILIGKREVRCFLPFFYQLLW